MAGARKPLSPLARNYLLLYNGIQCVGWSIIWFKMWLHIANVDYPSMGLWKFVENLVIIFQSLALLEVVHGLIGIVPSDPFLTLAQISSRVFVVWGIMWSVRRINNSISVLLLLFSWTITEIIRYSYYFLNMLQMVPKFVVWCRYSFFIVLYPAGVIGEVFTMLVALPYIKDYKIYTFDLPNRANFSFYYYYLVILIALSYVPMFPKLYLHMMSQRKKVLSPPKATKAE